MAVPGATPAAAAGAHVTASVRNAELRDAVAGLGAHAVLDPDATPDGGPYDVLLELVGAPNLAANLHALAPGGRVVVIGVGAGFLALPPDAGYCGRYEE